MAVRRLTSCKRILLFSQVSRSHGESQHSTFIACRQSDRDRTVTGLARFMCMFFTLKCPPLSVDPLTLGEVCIWPGSDDMGRVNAIATILTRTVRPLSWAIKVFHPLPCFPSATMKCNVVLSPYSNTNSAILEYVEPTGEVELGRAYCSGLILGRHFPVEIWNT